MNRQELKDKIDACNGDMFLAYGYIKQLEELDKKNIKQTNGTEIK